MTEFNVSESTKAQEKYCKDNDAPHFAPRSGNCFNCHRNIYEQFHWVFTGGMGKKLVNEDDADISTGITVKKASESLVTGCPHCNRSYCD